MREKTKVKEEWIKCADPRGESSGSCSICHHADEDINGDRSMTQGRFYVEEESGDVACLSCGARKAGIPRVFVNVERGFATVFAEPGVEFFHVDYDTDGGDLPKLQGAGFYCTTTWSIDYEIKNARKRIKRIASRASRFSGAAE